MDSATRSSESRFLALGDSYTIGEGVAPSERWPVQLVGLLAREGIAVAAPEIIAKTGWTTDDLDAAIDHAEPKAPYDLVTLLIGVNNQYRGRDTEEYRRHFAALLDRAIALAGGNAKSVVVLSIPDWGVTPFASGRDTQKIAREVDQYNAINREQSVRKGSRYVDVTPYSRTASTNQKLIAADKLHPSAAMYAEWARLALPEAREAVKANQKPETRN